ncbi:hypothetical protein SNEBB_003407 [Seison nebaliae]|nr:hypothetical protein SNEBB_003407 [Seison nebaliae]
MSSHHCSEPPSAKYRKPKDDDDDGTSTLKRQSRLEYRKQKELEEQRKAGDAPAAVDEVGNDINPHIPQYMVDVPWYATNEHNVPTLRHQRVPDSRQKKYDKLDKTYVRGGRSSEIVTKFRKGACENCGAVTHKKKDCCERPRKVGAKFTMKNFCRDEILQPKLNLSYDGKRDRWSGVDGARIFNQLSEDFQKFEQAKQIYKNKQLEKNMIYGNKDELEDDEDKYADDMAQPGQKIDETNRISVRNLRIREDIAKYLLNLNLDSAYYDAKSRSMRENPYDDTEKDNGKNGYIGDNFIRYSGETRDFAKAQLFAWEMSGKELNVNFQASPSKTAQLMKAYKEKSEELHRMARENVINKYKLSENGPLDENHLKILGQSEDYVQYKQRINMPAKKEIITVTSRYCENIFPLNHTTIWGSYWKDGKWGYRCCFSLLKSSYCTGEAGKLANEKFSEDNCMDSK